MIDHRACRPTIGRFWCGRRCVYLGTSDSAVAAAKAPKAVEEIRNEFAAKAATLTDAKITAEAATQIYEHARVAAFNAQLAAPSRRILAKPAQRSAANDDAEPRQLMAMLDSGAPVVASPQPFDSIAKARELLGKVRARADQVGIQVAEIAVIEGMIDAGTLWDMRMPPPTPTPLRPLLVANDDPNRVTVIAAMESYVTARDVKLSQARYTLFTCLDRVRRSRVFTGGSRRSRPILDRSR